MTSEPHHGESPETDVTADRQGMYADHNPYTAPRSAVVEEQAVRRIQLAEPWERLVARLIDNAIVLAILFGLLFVVGQFSALPSIFADESMLSTVLYSALGLVTYLLVQGPLLRSSGQTWGKRVFKIHIVDMSRRKPVFWKIAILRELPLGLFTLIPMVGQILALINALMIARMDRRCGHDLLAGTQVVRFLKDAPGEGAPPL